MRDSVLVQVFLTEFEQDAYSREENSLIQVHALKNAEEGHAFVCIQSITFLVP